MEVTTKQMRKSVQGWLTEEGATVEQAMKLHSAIYAGAIGGNDYAGHRENEDRSLLNVVEDFSGDVDPGEQDEDGYRKVERSCGCLVDTFERIRHRRPVQVMLNSTAETFALATMIGLGDTPSNSKWARAAAKGVEDYIVWLEAA